MAKTVLGKIGMTLKGEYNEKTEYGILDVVKYKGSSYVCIVEISIGIEPSNENNWQLVAERGDTPYVGKNGNWFIGIEDTGIPSVALPVALTQAEYDALEKYENVLYYIMEE